MRLALTNLPLSDRAGEKQEKGEKDLRHLASDEQNFQMITVRERKNERESERVTETQVTQLEERVSLLECIH